MSAKKTNLLFWEDPANPNSQEGLSRSLHSLSVRLLPASTAEGCLKWLQGSEQVDLLVFTLGDNPEIRMKEYRQLKKRPEMLDVPSLILVSKEGLERQGQFLRSCDDFVSSEASPQEILLRILRLARHFGMESKNDHAVLQLGALQIHPGNLRVQRNGKDLKLTPLEFRLLLYFYKYQGRVLGRDELLRQVWGYEDISHTRTVDTFVKRLRSKLGGEGRFIETMRAVGYRMKQGFVH
jgi:two-component system, OmpR family, phosphate regulon response regulator PhoB